MIMDQIMLEVPEEEKVNLVQEDPNLEEDNTLQKIYNKSKEQKDQNQEEQKDQNQEREDEKDYRINICYLIFLYHYMHYK